jgi:hypothetical protein
VWRDQQKYQVLVGVAGFEPATPHVPNVVRYPKPENGHFGTATSSCIFVDLLGPRLSYSCGHPINVIVFIEEDDIRLGAADQKVRVYFVGPEVAVIAFLGLSIGHDAVACRTKS